MVPVRSATATANELSVEVAVNINNARPHVTVRFIDIPGCSGVVSLEQWERLVEDVAVGAAFVDKRVEVGE